MRVHVLLAALIAVVLLAFRVAAAEPAPQAASNEYLLGTGDKLKIAVFGEETLSGEYEIDGNGTLSLSLIGEIQAKGYTLRQFTSALKTRLTEYLKAPRISVEVINYRPFYIIGEVKTPGQYPYVNGLSIINSIAIAGGYTYRANENEVILQRNGQEFYVPADGAAIVLPGDTIVVRERYF